jgi:Protein of unknown function (DUF3168)
MLAADLTAYLKADTTVATAVSGRVFPNIVPQGSAFPAISYNQVSGVRLYDINNGPTGRAMPRITINSWSDRYITVRQLADAVRERLNGFRGIMGSTNVGRITLDNEFDTFEEEAGQSGIHRVVQDYIISFEEGA